jgi:hypothetical protein
LKDFLHSPELARQWFDPEDSLEREPEGSSVQSNAEPFNYSNVFQSENTVTNGWGGQPDLRADRA